MKTALEYLITMVDPKTDITKLTPKKVANMMEAYAIYYHNGLAKRREPICSCGNPLTDKELYYSTCLKCGNDVDEQTCG